ncbi:kinase-like protein [Gigaspora margarita]|uniref:Kinase-like protein n=1 Tax=Gigaspora margarita TaxID=4874 RepID=A0A8H4AAB6_GIGMA|nr:kinase-like protein [Gigaspora margarita]
MIGYGNTSLIYYYVLYLYKDIGSTKNKNKAKELISEFITTQVADNDSHAQFNIGDLYFNSKLGIKINKEKGEKYLRLEAKNNYKNVITLYKKNKINFINQHNYFEKFEVAFDFYNSRNRNNKQEVEKINCKLFDKLKNQIGLN